MKQVNSITIKAPLNKIFLAASDLTRWPEFLPHYRYNRFLTHTPSGGTVRMSCVRSGLVTTWVSEYLIDTKRCQLHFEHLKSTLNASVGMKVVWNFKKKPNGPGGGQHHPRHRPIVTSCLDARSRIGSSGNSSSITSRRRHWPV